MPLSSACFSISESYSSFKAKLNDSYYSSSRKATKFRREVEANIKFECLIGIELRTVDNNEIYTDRINNYKFFKVGDKLISINGAKLNWSYKDLELFPKGPWTDINKIVVQKGDIVSVVIEREGKTEELKVPCDLSRKKNTEFMEDYARAHLKGEYKKFLKKWDVKTLQFGLSPMSYEYLSVLYLAATRNKVSDNEFIEMHKKVVEVHIAHLEEMDKQGYFLNASNEDIVETFQTYYETFVNSLGESFSVFQDIYPAQINALKELTSRYTRTLNKMLKKVSLKNGTRIQIFGPRVFGLTFGDSESANEFKKIKSFKLNEIFNTIETPCESKLFAVNSRDRNFYSGYLKQPERLNFSNNIHGADYGNRRLSGGYYKANVLGYEVDMCFAYFDDQLFNVFVNSTSSSFYDIALDSLTERYGPARVIRPDEDFSPRFVLHIWHNKSSTLFIDATLGAISYSYPTVRNQFLKWASNIYNSERAEYLENSPF